VPSLRWWLQPLNRDVAALVKEVGRWHRRIAGFYGGLRDAVETAGGHAGVLQVEMAKFWEVERLEAEGRNGEA
jgi:hypothetical protein